MSDAVFCEEAENLRKLHLELNRRLLQDGIFLSAELRQLFIQLFVDPLPEPRLAGRGNRLFSSGLGQMGAAGSASSR